MPNIVVTEMCNLKCEYCFADSMMKGKHISQEEFLKILSFIRRDGTNSLGLIGGEPLVHPHIDKLLEMAYGEGIEHVSLFTNGVFLDRIKEEVKKNRNLSILINVNSPEDIGTDNYARMYNNINDFVKDDMKDRLNFGVNIYKENQRFEYVIELLKEFGYNKLRCAIVVPNDDVKLTMQEYFFMLKPTTIHFFQELLDNDIIPRFDCNAMPDCILETIPEPDKEKMKEKCAIAERNIFSQIKKCHPVIDIFSDYTAIRCFGLSRLTKVSLDNFQNVAELKSFFIDKYDSVIDNKIIGCQHCEKYKVSCYAGCLKFYKQKIKGGRVLCC